MAGSSSLLACLSAVTLLKCKLAYLSFCIRARHFFSPFPPSLPPSLPSLLPTKQGLVLLSLLPAIGLLTHFQRLYHKSVLRREILLTFLLTMIFLSPLVILENFFSFGAVIQTKIASQAAKEGRAGSGEEGRGGERRGEGG
jgi:hypothetical protein